MMSGKTVAFGNCLGLVRRTRKVSSKVFRNFRPLAEATMVSEARAAYKWLCGWSRYPSSRRDPCRLSFPMLTCRANGGGLVGSSFQEQRQPSFATREAKLKKCKRGRSTCLMCATWVQDRGTVFRLALPYLTRTTPYLEETPTDALLVLVLVIVPGVVSVLSKAPAGLLAVRVHVHSHACSSLSFYCCICISISTLRFSSCSFLCSLGIPPFPCLAWDASFNVPHLTIHFTQPSSSR